MPRLSDLQSEYQRYKNSDRTDELSEGEEVFVVDHRCSTGMIETKLRNLISVRRHGVTCVNER